MQKLPKFRCGLARSAGRARSGPVTGGKIERIVEVMDDVTDLVRCPNCGRRNRVPAAATGSPRCGNCHRPLPWITDAGDDTFGEIAEAAALPVLVDLWAPWCGPCRMVSPALAKLATEMAGRIKLVKVNVDDSPRLQSRFGVQSIPTLLMLRRGKVVARQVGAPPEPALRSWVNQALQAPEPAAEGTAPQNR
jgi:thioredoxin 2